MIVSSSRLWSPRCDCHCTRGTRSPAYKPVRARDQRAEFVRGINVAAKRKAAGESHIVTISGRTALSLVWTVICRQVNPSTPGWLSLLSLSIYLSALWPPLSASNRIVNPFNGIDNNTLSNILLTSSVFFNIWETDTGLTASDRWVIEANMKTEQYIC